MSLNRRRSFRFLFPCGKKQWLVNDQTISFRLNLKQRVDIWPIKTSMIDGLDPYALKTTDFTQDIAHLPLLRSVLCPLIPGMQSCIQ